MPTYQYACTACGHGFEAVQSFSDAALTSCPECEGRLRKVFSAVSVVFKGSGFYRTDSRSPAGAKSNGDAGGSADREFHGSKAAGKDGVGKETAAKDTVPSANGRSATKVSTSTASTTGTAA